MLPHLHRLPHRHWPPHLRAQTSALLSILALLATLLTAPHAAAQNDTHLEDLGASWQSHSIHWRTIQEGYEISRVTLGYQNYLIASEVLLLRIDPKLLKLQLVTAKDFHQRVMDVRTMCKARKAQAGINTHFFDPQGSPLGLVVRAGVQEHRLQKGGSVLTGVFQLQQQMPQIIHRDQYKPSETIELALQAGPRLISKGVAVPLKSSEKSSRRSGIAVTKDGKVLLFATFLRLPGATLQQIQKLLLRPELEVHDALNLDGGGSSQLFVSANSAIQGDMFISGGDPVPVALLVTKEKNEES